MLHLHKARPLSLRRRSPLLVSLALLLPACGFVGDAITLEGPGPEPTPTPTATSVPTDDVDEDALPDDDPGAEDPSQQEPTPGPPPPAPDAPDAYEPHPAETHPNAKLLGAEVAQALTTYEAGESFADVTGRLASGATRERIAEEARGLYHEGAWSRGEIIYPQFGGLTHERASIMVVLRQTIGEPGADEPRTETRTIDVRLKLQDQSWMLEGIADDGGQPVERPDDLPDVALAVLDDERIELPDSARWDIYQGDTRPELLRLLHRLAEATGDVGVVVLATGHPYHVFGTDRMSDHLRGRAVDIYRIGGELVIEGRLSQESATYRATTWLYDDEAAPVIGSPWALDAFGGRSFTDPVHADHLHAAVRPTNDEIEGEGAEE